MASLLTKPLSPDMGPAVLDHLRQYSALPDRGIVAGQAVTSALLAVYGDGHRRGPVNDIDIFTDDDAARRVLQMHFNLDHHSNGPGKRSFKVSVGRHEYEHLYMPEITARPTLSITRVARQDILNFISVKPRKVHQGGDAIAQVHASDVIASFDLNCVEAGVDLKTGRLTWTRDFSWFIKTAQLQITNVHGEVHSLTRILKKMEEMPWMFCDMEATGRTLMFTSGIKHSLEDMHPAGSMRERAPQQQESRSYAPLLGPAYMERVMRHREKIEQWFNIEAAPLVIDSHELFIARPKVLPDSSQFSLFGVAHRASLFALSGDTAMTQNSRFELLQHILPVALQGAPGLSYRLGMVNGAAVERRLEALRKAGQHFVDGRKLLDEKRQEAARARQDAAADLAAQDGMAPVPMPANRRPDALPTFGSLFTQASVEAQGSAYLEGQVDENNVIALEAFLHAHEGFRKILIGLNFEDQVQAMKNVKLLDRRHNGLAIGALESSLDRSKAFLPQTFCDLDALAPRVAALVESLSQPLDVPPLTGIKQDGRVHLKELLSPLDLFYEGSRMRHCVGGYTHQVRNGTSRIISLTSGKTVLDASTLEVRIVSIQGMHIVRSQQHKGFANGPPPQGHDAAAEAYLLEASLRLNQCSAQQAPARTVDQRMLMRAVQTSDAPGGEVSVYLTPLDTPSLQAQVVKRIARGNDWREKMDDINRLLVALTAKMASPSRGAILEIECCQDSQDPGQGKKYLKGQVPVYMDGKDRIKWAEKTITMDTLRSIFKSDGDETAAAFSCQPEAFKNFILRTLVDFRAESAVKPWQDYRPLAIAPGMQEKDAPTDGSALPSFLQRLRTAAVNASARTTSTWKKP